MSKIESLVVVGALAALAVGSSPGAARGADLMREGAKMADAEFYWESEDGCAYGFTSVRARQTTLQAPPGAPSVSTRLELMVSRSNSCTGEWYWVDGSTEDVSFELRGNLQGATARATVEACGWGGSCMVATVDLVWEGVGELFRGGYVDYGFGPYLGRYRFNGSSREAAARGTVIDESGASIASGQSNYASLGSRGEKTVTPQ